MKKITFMCFLFATAIGFAQMPTVAAPTPPTRVATDVISIYGDAYTNVSGVNINPGWGQTTVTTQIQIAGNNTLQYANFNYQGTDWSATPQNISNMQFLHVDIWTNAQSPNVFAISSGAEVPKPITAQPGSWKSVDIPVSGLTANLTSVIQFKFDGGVNAGTIYLDNLYFWRAALPAGTPVYGTFTVPAKNTGDAAFTLTAPTSTSPAPFTYSSSNTAVATISGSTVTVVGAGTSTITASQVASGSFLAGSITAPFVVSSVPTVAAPTPPNRPAADVKSIFSDAYAPLTTFAYTGDSNSYNTSWCNATTTAVQIAGNATNRVAGLGSGLVAGVSTTSPPYAGSDLAGACEGIDFLAGRFDASTFTTFHIDLWTPISTMALRNISLKLSNFNTANTGELNAIEYNATNATPLPNQLPSTNPNPGTWLSFDIPLSSFTIAGGGSLARNNIAQFIISTNLGTVFYDNAYFHKGTLSNNTFDALSVKMYPNPATNIVTIEALSTIQNVSLFNVVGQEVLTKTATTNSLTLDISSLQAGVYVVKTNIDGQIATSRIVKQ